MKAAHTRQKGNGHHLGHLGLGSICVLVLLLTIALGPWALHADAAVPEGKVAVQEAYAKLPLHFEANRGQTDSRVKFQSRGSGYTLFLTPSEAVMVLRSAQADPSPLASNHEPGTHSVLRMKIEGANPSPRVSGLEPLPGIVNYFIGKDPAKWRTNVPTYGKVQYRDLYPGVDLLYYGNQRQLEYDFVVRPGADPSSIVLSFQGADRVEVDAQGDLVLQTALGQIRQRKPVIYQEIDGARREIQGGYVLTDRDQVTFRVAAYDVRQPLVIDPVLFYSTYLGGSGNEGGSGIAVDAAGAVYVTGTTGSPDFTAGCAAPCTVMDSTLGGAFNAFVTKLNPTGTALIYTTYLGGSHGETAHGIAVDAAGAAYVTGRTFSADFPTTTGAFDETVNGDEDAFVAKLNPTGSGLAYSTYLGGSRSEQGRGIAVDTMGAAYVSGSTASTDFPTTLGAFDTSYNGSHFDAFVTKLNASGSALAYSTYLGGSGAVRFEGIDEGRGIAVDASGSAYVTGETSSADFPTTSGAFDTTYNSTLGAFALAFDVFVTKLNTTGSALVYSTYVGGRGSQSGFGIAVDSAGNAFVTGRTSSTDFPTTLGAFDTTRDGSDAFVTKLTPAGAGAADLVYSTYLGGSRQEIGFGIAVDADGHAYVTGDTDSTDFPTTTDALDRTCGTDGNCNPKDPNLPQFGTPDAFVTKLNPAGAGLADLVYSTYLGGSGGDGGGGIAVAAGAAYVTGGTAKADFPTTPRAFQRTFRDVSHAFVTKIADGEDPAQFAGKVNGEGAITVDGGMGMFEFSVQAKTTTEPVSGELQYVNHETGAEVHSVGFSGLVIVGKTATFDGTCTVNGAPGFFSVEVTDNGEPGTSDTFRISFSPAAVEGDTLRSGNIQLHQ
jgi:hypothetical protein